MSFIVEHILDCSNKKGSRNELIKEWQGKEIVFPDNSIFTKFGVDTISVSKKADYTMLMSVNSFKMAEYNYKNSVLYAPFNGVVGDIISKEQFFSSFFLSDIFITYFNLKNMVSIYLYLANTMF